MSAEETKRDLPPGWKLERVSGGSERPVRRFSTRTVYAGGPDEIARALKAWGLWSADSGITREEHVAGQRAIAMAKKLAKDRCSVDPTSGPRCEEPGRDKMFSHVPWCGPCESRRIIAALGESS